VDAELCVRLREVELDGADRDDEALRDFLVREPLRRELGDPSLRARQLTGIRRLPGADTLQLGTARLGPTVRSELPTRSSTSMSAPKTIRASASLGRADSTRSPAALASSRHASQSVVLPIPGQPVSTSAA
jgi:hypothetical protein